MINRLENFNLTSSNNTRPSISIVLKVRLNFYWKYCDTNWLVNRSIKIVSNVSRFTKIANRSLVENNALTLTLWRSLWSETENPKSREYREIRQSRDNIENPIDNSSVRRKASGFPAHTHTHTHMHREKERARRRRCRSINLLTLTLPA